ncbi:hypothetical protein LTV02_12805 [Nocardia yamanashiensis]|uniref:hypothetical protein n=1 Tax=Nocardia yamanashiensis TaxID=209247 RepID=UPI001E388D3A|nr:hypothetical protein [Nocardia yamanashiensis]UGT44210.1 hypothetical protein LTV02_12805 [Nocardia yamanashiensis]
MTQRLSTADPQWSDWMREKDSLWKCPADRVLVGREHRGDENGKTRYRYARLVLGEGNDAVTATVTPGEWSSPMRESGSRFVAEDSRVLIGREHQGDEAGVTRYLVGTVEIDGQPVSLTDTGWSESMSESESQLVARDGEVMIGRAHSGDENGATQHQNAAPILPD